MQAGETPVKVWDAPVRLFHWLLVLLFAFQIFSGNVKGDWMEWHMRSGYAILALVLFRILWGFAGSSTARFSNFLAGPAACIAFAKKLLARAPAPSASHNPLGGWMVLALLLALLFQVGTGLFANDDVLVEGPLASLVSKALSDQLTGWHDFNVNLLLLLVAVHVMAVGYHAVGHEGESHRRDVYRGEAYAGGRGRGCGGALCQSVARAGSACRGGARRLSDR
jgi:cytochrome b